VFATAPTSESIAISGGLLEIRRAAYNHASPDDLNVSTIEALVKKKSSGIQYCYDKYSTQISGIVVVNFTIGLYGFVNGYGIQSSTLNEPDVEACILRMVKQWRFPNAKFGEVNVSYPFEFVSRPVKPDKTRNQFHEEGLRLAGCDGILGEPHIQDVILRVAASGPVTAKAFNNELERKAGCLNRCAIEWAEKSTRREMHPRVVFSVKDNGTLKNIQVHASSTLARCIRSEMAEWVLQPSVYGVNVTMDLSLSKSAVTSTTKPWFRDPYRIDP
jgi:hypothetical protein